MICDNENMKQKGRIKCLIQENSADIWQGLEKEQI